MPYQGVCKTEGCFSSSWQDSIKGYCWWCEQKRLKKRKKRAKKKKKQHSKH